MLFAEKAIFAKLSVNASGTKAGLKISLFFVAILFFVLTLARPQWGEEVKSVKRRGVNLVFMVDTSLSMLVEDLKPNRMQVVQREIVNLLNRLKGDRIGLVAFAGSSFMQVPLTLDYTAFQLFLEALDVGLIPDPGTSFEEGIRIAADAFETTSDDQRVLIIFSDGENHVGEEQALLSFLRENKIKVYAVGAATEKGGPIPLRDETANLSGYKKDRGGEVVISRLGGELMRTLAKGTGGLYYPATPSEKEIQLIYEDIQKIGKKELSEQQIVQRQDHFQLFLAIGLVLLALETVIGERKGVFQ